MIEAIALVWSVVQLWVASGLGFFLGGVFLLNDAQLRAIHLGFAVLLAFVITPHKWRHLFWLIGTIAAFCALYRYIFYEQLSMRPGLPTFTDLMISGIGLGLLLEAARRRLGLPLVILSGIFIFYILAGHLPLIPDAIRWAGASINKAMSHLWLGDQGVYGIALGVSAKYVFLFVLFGALLEKAGAGHYFIRLAFALLGHLRGGPAKAAVVASGLTGMVSGSSIANVVTTGTFTIPLMKRVGFSSEKAGAIEVASSVGGQMMPPVMGAAAFLMAEYVGISYVDVIRHSFLPAILSYIALLYLVHLEACKSNMTGLLPSGEKIGLIRGGITTCSIIIIAGISYFVLSIVKQAAGGWSILPLLFVLYLLLLKIVAKAPDLPEDDPSRPLTHAPKVSETFRAGLHYFLPVFTLIWALVIERFSPTKSAFLACLALIFIILTQHLILAFFRKQKISMLIIKTSLLELKSGLETGALNMIGVALATSVAGIIVGAVTLSSIGLVMASFVELLSGGNLILMLIWVGLLSLVLGMGLPTTANYIVVSSLMAPVVVELGAQHGLVVPLIAVHLYVFYFGIMADVTPPVGLASFAAAGVSKGHPIKTGVYAFFYSLRMLVLPFIFIFNLELLMIGIDHPIGAAMTITASTLGILLFSAAAERYFLVKNRVWETLALLLICFSLFRPGFWLDQVYPPSQELPKDQIMAYVEQLAENAKLETVLERVDFDTTEPVILHSFLDFGKKGPAIKRFEQAGIDFLTDDFKGEASLVGPLDDQKYEPELSIIRIMVPTERPAKEWFYIPAVILLMLVYGIQKRRKEQISPE